MSSVQNRLANERSPYLLQHASNPVDWYPWGEEAFQKARESNKLIFLSVGYSTCHWCHVMERESFENEEVAKIMNENFVNVKVDREERPDVDKVYMTFIQASSGGGGWPMSVFLTPKLKPIFGGTYFPPENSMGRPGFKTLMMALASQWESDPEKLVQSGDKIIEALAKAHKAKAEEFPPGAVAAKTCFGQLLKSYDPEFGGFSTRPKFPQPVNLNFLFRFYSRRPDDDIAQQALKMCLTTLDMMALGGINDHISKGFARYSTDQYWHVPHFEKMLYDQGQLTVSYSQAYLATKDAKYAKVVNDIIEYVCRDLRHPDGGFYSAEDADSLPQESANHKKEGAFCVWTKDELSKLLPNDNVGTKGKSLSDLFCAVFGVKDGGNVDPSGDPHGELTGQNVLTRVGSKSEEIIKSFGLKDESELENFIEKCRKVLFEARLKRPRPHLDDKILTSWNGLMISGLCHAAAALKKPEFAAEAKKTVDFIKKNLYDDSRKVLLRSIYTNKDKVEQTATPIDGFVDDYAFFIRALLDLYEVTFDTSYIEWAFELQNTQDKLFWDSETGGYFQSAEGDNNIVLRLKDDQDGAEPASNSVAAYNLMKMTSLLDKPDFKEKAEKIFVDFGQRLKKIPLALPEMVNALMLKDNPPIQIIITGDKDNAKAREMIDRVQAKLLPDKILVLADGNSDSILYKNMKILADIPTKPEDAGKSYVCKNFACSAPVTSPEDLEKLLSSNE